MFGFLELGYRDAPCSRRLLRHRDSRALRCFYVRPEMHTQGICALLHAFDVAVHACEINYCRGRLNSRCWTHVDSGPFACASRLVHRKDASCPCNDGRIHHPAVNHRSSDIRGLNHFLCPSDVLISWAIGLAGWLDLLRMDEKFASHAHADTVAGGHQNTSVG